MYPNRALAKHASQSCIAKYASQSCTCQICIPIVHLLNMHPKRALAKYASQTCTDQICVPSMHLPNMHLKHALAKYIAAHQGCQELDKNLSETFQNNNSCSGSARTKGGGGTPPRGASIKSAALRRECWRALNLLSGLGKSLPERNLWIPWAARLPPTLTLNGLPRLFFFVLFFDRFLEGTFSIFDDFRPSLGTPKITKNQ